MIRRPPRPTLFPYTTLSRSNRSAQAAVTAPTSVCTSQAPADTQAPSVPTTLKKTATSSSTISVAWHAATDNVGVVGYDLYRGDRKSTRLNFSHGYISYAVFC